MHLQFVSANTEREEERKRMKGMCNRHTHPEDKVHALSRRARRNGHHRRCGGAFANALDAVKYEHSGAEEEAEAACDHRQVHVDDLSRSVC